MTRNAVLPATGYALADQDIPDMDEFYDINEAVVSSSKNEQEVVNVLQYVVYSASFQVPAFYFVVSDRSEWQIRLSRRIYSSAL